MTNVNHSEQEQFFHKKLKELEERTGTKFKILGDVVGSSNIREITLYNERDGMVEWLDLEMIIWQNTNNGFSDAKIYCKESSYEQEE